MTKRRMLVLALVALGLAGCGSQPPAEVQTNGPAELSRLVGTYATLSAADAPSGGFTVSVVETADGPRPRVLAVLDGRTEVLDVPTAQPLAALRVWAVDDGAAVLGVECPAMSELGEDEAVDLMWDGDRLDNAPTICGSTSYQLWQWSMARGWVQHDVSTLDSENGYELGHAAAGTALFIRNDGRAPTFVTVDGATGDVADLPAPLDTGGSAESVFAACLTHDGRPVAAVVWTGANPPGVESYLDDGAVEPSGPSGLVVFGERSGGWEPIGLSGEASTVDGASLNCGPGGFWTGTAGAGTIIEVDDGRATASPLPPVGVDATEFTIRPSRGSGAPVLIGQGAPNGEAPDAPRQADAHVLRDGAWEPLRSPRVGTGFQPVAMGDRLVVLQSGGATHQHRVSTP